MAKIKFYFTTAISLLWALIKIIAWAAAVITLLVTMCLIAEAYNIPL